jgi:Lipopolysaccharide-assembly
VRRQQRFNRDSTAGQQKISYQKNMNKLFRSSAFALIIFFSLLLSSCGVYTFKDVSIDYTKYKTIKIDFIDNRASYKNPQLSPKITDALQQKIGNQTKLTRTNNDDANYRVSGYISTYSVSTSGISSQQAATNRLTVGVHITLLDNVQNKSTDYDVSRDFDFTAGLSLQQAENQLMPDIIKNVTDEIFNKLFSNW